MALYWLFLSKRSLIKTISKCSKIKAIGSEEPAVVASWISSGCTFVRGLVRTQRSTSPRQQVGAHLSLQHTSPCSQGTAAFINAFIQPARAVSTSTPLNVKERIVISRKRHSAESALFWNSAKGFYISLLWKYMAIPLLFIHSRRGFWTRKC